MNPLEWLKSLYATFGVRYPTASLVGMMVLGALFFAALWLIAAQQYEKYQAATSTPSPVTTAPSKSTTYGPGSPIMPDNKGTVTITGERDKPDHPSPKGQ